MTRLFTFIGVTTRSSSIMQIFPRWRDILGLGTDVQIVGWDVPIHAPTERYRQVVQALKHDRNNVGGLVTTHKIDLFRAAEDLFDEVDDHARRMNEVSCLAKREGRLTAWAKDSIAAGRVLEHLIGPDHFARTGGHMLCFGAGGAARAIVAHLLTCAPGVSRPGKLLVTDLNPDRLEALQALHHQLASDIPGDYLQIDGPHVNDQLLAALPSGSLTINATGMGKDIPGSPVSAEALFPKDSIVWELNYRGDLGFLHQAESQQVPRALRVEDGWQYFISGWTTALEEVFNRSISAEERTALARAAEFARPNHTRHTRHASL
ncbi:MAG: shikimate dehydrogenase [Chloroflexota bacterium]